MLFLGKEPPMVQVQFGQTIFKYIGEKCTNERNYTVNIRMICDFTAKERNKIEWFPDVIKFKILLFISIS